MMASIRDSHVRHHNPFDSNAPSQHERDGIADATIGEGNTSGSDSDSEWEYEYSTNETETFYVTLDLPVARSHTKIEHGLKGGRLTKRKDKWLNSTHIPFVDDKRNRHGKEDNEDLYNGAARGATEHDGISPEKDTASGAGLKDAIPVAAAASKGPIAGSNEDADRGFEEGISVSKADGTHWAKGAAQRSHEKDTPEASKSPGAASKGIPQDIQIMELHSRNPIVVYRNQQFECSWAENIGTELLFIKHSDICRESEEKLPIVRELPGEVDLLAVSGVRVVGRPINLLLKGGASENAPRKTQAKEQIHATQNPQTVNNHSLPEGAKRIPVSSGASQDRKAQARFLERLAAIKLKRGEHDEVTVNAIPRREGGARKERQQERRREQRILRNNHRSAQRKARARIRLAELDALDANEKRNERGGDNSSMTVPSSTANGGPLNGQNTLGQPYSRDQSMDADEDEDEDEDVEEEDEDEDEDESISHTDDNAITDPDDEDSDRDGNEDEMNELGNGDHDMDDDEEDYPDPGISNGIHTRPFNPEHMDIDVD